MLPRKAKVSRCHFFLSVKPSNDQHKHWAERKLRSCLPDLSGAVVSLWGLTYKPGTDTLRRSMAIELCRWLVGEGALLRVHDPAAADLPSSLANRVVRTALAAGCGSRRRGARRVHGVARVPRYSRRGNRKAVAGPTSSLTPIASGSICAFFREFATSLSVARPGPGTIMTQLLSGKVAIVTGANQGLGLQIARRYLASTARKLQYVPGTQIC